MLGYLSLLDPAEAACGEENKCVSGADFNQDVYADDFDQCLYLCEAEGDDCTYFTFFGGEAYTCYLYYACGETGPCEVKKVIPGPHMEV